ncbi:hypothetical protein ALC53_09640 [Atta colombica]|uniref:Uncharacterized protein n=1 Tax=Atta colombica TaxID=520822 RepID=A0A151I1I8_9HYME|nr:hypothetical protein ALC53_09640 [Atta colombica]
MCVRETTTDEGRGEDRVRNVRERCRLGERRGYDNRLLFPFTNKMALLKPAAQPAGIRGTRHPARNTVWTVENWTKSAPLEFLRIPGSANIQRPAPCSRHHSSRPFLLWDLLVSEGLISDSIIPDSIVPDSIFLGLVFSFKSPLQSVLEVFCCCSELCKSVSSIFSFSAVMSEDSLEVDGSSIFICS